MPDDTLNDTLSLPLCPCCAGLGYEPEEVLYGNAVAVIEVACSRCQGLGRLEPTSEAESLVIAAELYADARYEETPAWLLS